MRAVDLAHSAGLHSNSVFHVERLNRIASHSPAAEMVSTALAKHGVGFESRDGKLVLAFPAPK